MNFLKWYINKNPAQIVKSVLIFTLTISLILMYWYGPVTFFIWLGATSLLFVVAHVYVYIDDKHNEYLEEQDKIIDILKG
jgi:hypothetical protein